jgi:hypothetical protein
VYSVCVLCFPQHSDRDLFRKLLEDKTILRISSKMKIVLENTDNSLHYRTTYRSVDSAKAHAEVAARIVQYKPQSAKRSRKHKVHPHQHGAAGSPPQRPEDLMHYHRFPY